MNLKKSVLAFAFSALLLIQGAVQSHAQVSYYWLDTAAGNWTTVGNWSLVSNTGPSAGAVPTDGDLVFFNQTSGTINSNMDLTLGTGGLQGVRRFEFASGTFSSPGNADFTVLLAAPLRLTSSISNHQILYSAGSGNATIITSAGNGIELNTDADFFTGFASGVLTIADAGGGTVALNGHQLTLGTLGGSRLSVEATIGGSGSVLANGGGVISVRDVNAPLSVPDTTVLNLMGSIAASNLTVSSGTFLTGNGTITGSWNVNHGIAPGNVLNGFQSPTAVGTLNIAGNAQFQDGAYYIWQLGNANGGVAGTDWDLLALNGALTVSATGTKTIEIRNLDGTWTYMQDRAYKIISTTSAVSQADADRFTLTFGFFGNGPWGGQSLDNFKLEGRSDGLYLVEIPELEFSLAVGGLLFGLILRRSRSKRLALA